MLKPEILFEGNSATATHLGAELIPTSDGAADPNDVRGLFQALTEGGCGGLMGPTEERKPQEV